MLVPGLLIVPPELELNPEPKPELGCCSVSELTDWPCAWALASPQVRALQMAMAKISIRFNRMILLVLGEPLVQGYRAYH